MAQRMENTLLPLQSTSILGNWVIPSPGDFPAPFRSRIALQILLEIICWGSSFYKQR
jgi:hypothetical protein